MQTRTMRDTELVKRLSSLDGGAVLMGQLLTLERSVNDLLSYIPVSFPHYTRHTLPHSVETVDQIARLLLADDHWIDDGALNAMEIYVLCCAALLHDSGMVASETEQAAILADPTWARYVEQYAEAPWRDIHTTLERSGSSLEQRFLAFVDLRRLLADYLRRVHHHRSAALTLGEAPLPEFWFGDVRLRRAVANICEGHGLRHEALADDRRFPLQTDLAGHPVDVRFLTILLRLGDLLDISHDRACPLSSWAAGTVPSTSLVHWAQFKSVTHRSTSPERIEVHAECDEEDVYRVLRDWCRWMCEEATAAHALLARSPRHSRWHPPVATMGIQGATIIVEPSSGAGFIPADWRLSVDAGLVVERFMNSVHEDRFEGVVVELVQNALDATRCRAVAEGPDPIAQSQPHRLPESHRSEYPIAIALYDDATQDTAGRPRRATWLEIADRGLGMDAADVTQYLLQVGRSRYRSRSFQEEYQFSPASQFGVGFLTVFGISTHVEVDTLKRGGSEPVSVTITGPDDYVTRRPSTRSEPGTRLRIRIDRPIDREALARHLERLSASEFPIFLGRHNPALVSFDDVRRETGSPFAGTAFVEDRSTTFDIAVDQDELSGWINIRGFLRNEIVLLGRAPGEFRLRWYQNRSGPIERRLALRDTHNPSFGWELPEESLYLWGARAAKTTGGELSFGRRGANWSSQLDFRPGLAARADLTLDKRVSAALASRVRAGIDEAFRGFFSEYLASQPRVASDPALLDYRRELLEEFPMVPEIARLPTIELFEGGHSCIRSVSELRTLKVAVAFHSEIAAGRLQDLIDTVATRLDVSGVELIWPEQATMDVLLLYVLLGGEGGAPVTEATLPPFFDSDAGLLSIAQLSELGPRLLKELFRDREVSRLEQVDESWWCVVYSEPQPEEDALETRQTSVRRGPPPMARRLDGCSERVFCVCRPTPECRTHLLPDGWNSPGWEEVSPIVLNKANPLGRWVRDVCAGEALALVERAGEIEEELGLLVYRAACGDAKGVIRLNEGLDELRVLSKRSGFEPPPALQIVRDRKLGLATRRLARNRGGQT